VSCGLCSAILNVYLQLARLYLSGDRVPSAINVLENLNATDLPRGKKSVVHLLLATAYMKKRMFMKANAVCGVMCECVDPLCRLF
jgi:hypothetical protein